MKVDFKKYDEVKKIEKILEDIIEKQDISKTQISFEYRRDQILYYLTIASILFKEKQFNCELEIATDKTDYALDFSVINNDIDMILSVLLEYIEYRSLEGASDLIMEYGENIQMLCRRYFNRKNANYILRNQAIHIVEKDKKIKELLKINPFEINSYLEYSRKPFTHKEKIICDIVNYLQVTNILDIGNQSEALKIIKSLIVLNNYNNKEALEEIIIFIIGTVYQEAIERKIYDILPEISEMIENPEYNNRQIVNNFTANDYFSNKILATLLMSIMRMKENRLDELERKQSYIFIKRRLKK